MITSRSTHDSLKRFFYQMLRIITVASLSYIVVILPQHHAHGASFISTTTPLLKPSTTNFRNMMSQGNSKFIGSGMKLQKNAVMKNRSRSRGSSMTMFLGSDGILGVGAPEIAVTLLVGYFILGPSELYKLTKEIGKFIQGFRTLSNEASKSFETSMESQLELQELRKAQSELNNAFSFRRSINVDQDSEAFSEVPPMVEKAEGGVAAAAVASTVESEDKKKKKRRRRVKKKKVDPIMESDEFDEIPFKQDIPDELDFSDEFKKEMEKQLLSKPSEFNETQQEEEENRLRNERLDRLKNGQPSSTSNWYSSSSDYEQPELQQQLPEEKASEQSRFASQLSGNWNDQILANEDKLSPLAKVMEKLALLEEEKAAADARLDEEFRLRAENEEKFYRQKRQLLEEASVEISASAYDLRNGEGVGVNGNSTAEEIKV